MVERRVVWAIVVALACVLAGCSSKKGSEPKDTDGDGVPDVDDSTPDGGALPDGLTYNPGYVGPDGGYIEGDQVSFFCQSFANSTVAIDQNRTLSGSAHSHDMWSGDDSKIIFEGEVRTFQNGGNWFALPGAVVHPGAGRADFRLDWDVTFPGEGRQLGVDVPGIKLRPAADVNVDYLLNFTEPGQVQTIEFNFTANDKPHAEKTLWRFKMNPYVQDVGNAGAANAAFFQTGELNVNLVWTIHRVYDCLPVDPPHYDFWNGTTQRLVFEATSGPHDYLNNGATTTGRWYGWRNGGTGVPGNGTIPPGTANIVVVMTWRSSDPNTLPLALEYVGADRNATQTTTTWIRPPLASESGTTRTYSLDVHPLETDSPYATKSLWDFRWYIDHPGDDPQEGPGVGRFKGEVDWKVTAYRDGFAPSV